MIMFFGLTNSPTTFQTMMNKVFANMFSEGIVVVYLDNILFNVKIWGHFLPVSQCCSQPRHVTS